MSALGLFILILISLAIDSAPAETALGALKVLPKGAARHLARIEARDGTPGPERWHILVHDAEAENGFREYVVTNGELTASREVSQFAEALQSEDVIGSATIKVDSDKAARKAQRYADANEAVVTTMNYELRKDAASGKPFWKVTCLGESGSPIGAVMIAASEGKVVSREGFPVEPPKTLARSDGYSSEDENRQVTPETKREARPRGPNPNANLRTRLAPSDPRRPAPGRPLDPIADSPPVKVRRAEPVDSAVDREESQRRPSVIRRAANTGRRIMRGLLPF